MDSRDQFDQWVAMWDKAQEGFSKEPAKKPAPVQSYFGLQQVVPDEEEMPAPDQASAWRDIIGKSSFLTDGVLTEEMKLATGPGQGVKFEKNPVHFASTGMDQSPSPHQPTRVTPNFGDGPQLSELIDLRSKLSQLETKLQAAAIGKAHAAAEPATYDGSPVGTSYQKEINALWKRLNALSDKLTPDVQSDIA